MWILISQVMKETILYQDFRNWDVKRVAALFVYAFALIFSCQRVYVAIQAPRLERERRELTEAFMEALIPEPSTGNIERFKKTIWRKTTPKGLKLKRFIEGPDGTLVHDSSYVGEKAWDEDLEATEGSLKQIIDSNDRLKTEAKKKLAQDLGISGQIQESDGTWRERLATWKEMLEKEKLSEQLNSSKAKYVVEFDMKEVENSLRKDVLEKTSETEGTRALWISKRWWRYRPKLPYTYFLQKLDSSEV